MEIDIDYIDHLANIIIDLSPYLKNCTIAGGAIRDMLGQKEVEDIDIFYEHDALANAFNTSFVKANLFPTTLPNKPYYYDDGDFEVVFNGLTKEGYKVQLIRVDSVGETIGEFPFDFCKCTLDTSGLVIPDNAIYSFVHKTVYYNEATTGKNYLAKIKAKYPDYEFCPT